MSKIQILRKVIFLFHLSELELFGVLSPGKARLSSTGQVILFKQAVNDQT